MVMSKPKEKKLFMELLDLAFILSLAGGTVYLFVRVFSIAFSFQYTIISLIFAVLFLAGEFFVILHAFGFVINNINLSKKEIYHNIKSIKENEWPSVAVVMPARNEPVDVVEKTIATLKFLDYPNKKIYFIEDSTQESFIEEDKKLIEKYNINVFRPKNINGGKAAIINEFLKIADEKYIAIFDADQNPVSSFLKETVSMAEYDEKIAFVQTPQFYSNITASRIARSASMQQSIFFESISEAKAMSNAMFCCGTNVLIKKDLLMQAGGFDENSVTEDFSTSVNLHALGYYSVYYNHVRAFGMAPEDLPSYLKQQVRWSMGTTGAFLRITKYFFKKPSLMSLRQWWEYFLSSTYYFIGWSFLILMLCPIIFLFFNLPTYFITPSFYIFIFVPYYVAMSAVFYGTMKKRNYKLKEVYYGSMLTSLIFPVLIVSTIKGLIVKKFSFFVTPKNGAKNSLDFLALWPWTLAIILNALAITAGIFRIYSNPLGISINIFWCLYHIFFLSHIYYFNSNVKVKV